MIFPDVPGHQMNSCLRKNLGDAMVAFASLEEIEALFESTYGTDACPKDAGVFIRHISEGSLHCRVEVYVFPASVSIAKRVNAQPCGRLSVTGLDLLVGSMDAWSKLFPERRG